MSKASPRHIDPISELGGRLLEVEKPARYLGGEAGSIRKTDTDLYTIALCFPDLYEIGMSNNAIRILYSGLNTLSKVRAERVFAPAPDFEALLASANIPLYTLESGIALSDVDMLGFSLGYELAATSVLSVLESGRIPLRAAERGEGDPIVIAGGPAVTNPHPLSSFLDVAFIGEAEAGFYKLTEELAVMKNAGAKRFDLLEHLAGVDAVWMPGNPRTPPKKARRAIFSGFSRTPASTAFPLPVVKAIQDHGSVEIMRGCPNGCRFCHAGYFYRPQREKPYELVRAEVEELVSKGGYREITLASLSSGDYSNIGSLLDRLNEEFGPRKISFQLPSLKVNSFTLPIIRKLAEVRKSGLTFAVETPIDAWQKGINKEVSFEKMISILEEARATGFKQAKFYFMIGLPVPGRGLGEAESIIGFIKRLQARISMQININVGVFVPKPHTPYQWAAQLTEGEALESVNFLRSEFRKFRNVKLSYHSPFISQLEGIIARGDERVGEIIFSAYQKGARLDAWEEHFDRDLWRSVIENAGWPVVDECCSEKKPGTILPWNDISVRLSTSYFQRELERSEHGETTSACVEKCTESCGICAIESHITKVNEIVPKTSDNIPRIDLVRRAPTIRMIFRYSKRGVATYLQHLSIIDAFNRAFQISRIDVAYSEGFNPMPRLETTQPIPIAIESDSEIASVLLYEPYDPEQFVTQINGSLPLGLHVEGASCFPVIEGKKQRTIGSLEWGSDFIVSDSSYNRIAALALRLVEVIASRSIPETSVEFFSGDNFLRLRLRKPERKEFNLIKILETCCIERPIQSVLALRRSDSYADLGDGLPISFFDAYLKLC